MARVGKVAYRMRLPDQARLHPVFHISQLKVVVGDDLVETALPDKLFRDDLEFLSEFILRDRWVWQDGTRVRRLLVQWRGKGEDDVTWFQRRSSWLSFLLT